MLISLPITGSLVLLQQRMEQFNAKFQGPSYNRQQTITAHVASLKLSEVTVPKRTTNVTNTRNKPRLSNETNADQKPGDSHILGFISIHTQAYA